MNELSTFLKRHNIHLKKGLGQNFLHDKKVLEKIVNASDIQSDDHIVEIGPGVGILTAELLKRAGKVTAIEIDSELIPVMEAYLQEHMNTKGKSRLHIINQNALEIPLPETPYKIVANIPYHITSPLLKHAFLESEQKPESMTLLIQREVAEKICDVENASRLTILVGLFGKPHIVDIVEPEAFIPPPKVDSAILHIQSLSEPITDKNTMEEVFRLTKIAFGQKRKMLRGTIGKCEGIIEAMEHTGIDGQRRPQILKLEEWIRLAERNAEPSS